MTAKSERRPAPKPVDDTAATVLAALKSLPYKGCRCRSCGILARFIAKLEAGL